MDGTLTQAEADAAVRALSAAGIGAYSATYPTRTAPHVAILDGGKAILADRAALGAALAERGVAAKLADCSLCRAPLNVGDPVAFYRGAACCPGCKEEQEGADEAAYISEQAAGRMQINQGLF